MNEQVNESEKSTPAPEKSWQQTLCEGLTRPGKDGDMLPSPLHLIAFGFCAFLAIVGVGLAVLCVGASDKLRSEGKQLAQTQPASKP